MKKTITTFLLCLTIMIQACGVTGCAKKELKIYGKDNELFATISTVETEEIKLEEEGYRSYIEIVLEEAIQIIMENDNCSAKEAERKLLEEEYAIYTSFEKKVYQSLKNSYSDYEDDDLSFGSAVTDNNGNLIATYGAGNYEEGYRNYATTRTAPYSSLKPLSVYTPALETGIISWSKTYHDSPLKQIEEDDGSMRDWPANASNTYSNENVCVCDAIKVSLNTVAVKCLKEYGVQNSIQYLKENFDMSLTYEESRIQTLGEDEIIGNIALGYLYDGVSPVEMAGYYQSFATSGIYYAPKTVQKICDNDGNVIYELVQEGKQVMNYETAFVMNELLQGVVSKGATGEEAYCENVLVGGKTGTGTDGNWFVGFTPEYTCAVWHGKQITGNHAAAIFSEAVSGFEHDENATFPECKTVKTSAYCMESGGLFSGKCTKIDKGYYTSIDNTEKCDVH